MYFKFNKLLAYQVIIFTTLYIGYGFYYFTRKSISFMLPHFSRNTTNSLILTKSDIGIIISCQNFAYAFSKLIGGILSDVVSCRILFGAGLFLSGILNITLKKDIKVFSLYLISFFIGLTQGVGWPCCGKLLQNWFSKSKLGTCWSLLSTSANVAGTIGPLIITSIAINYHWTYGFMIPGCICMTMGYLVIILLRNKPSDIGLPDIDNQVNGRKKENLSNQIEEESNSFDSCSDDLEREDVSIIQRVIEFLSYPFFICICLSCFIVQLIKTLFSDWAQMVLIKSYKIDHYNASYFVSTFELSGIFGSIFSGIITDAIYSYKSKRSLHKFVQPNAVRIRMIVNLFYLLGMIIFMHLFNFNIDVNVSNTFLITISASLGFFCYGCISLLGLCALEFTPNQFSGTSHSIAAFASNIGSVFAGLPVGILSKYYSWSIAFKSIEFLAIFVLIFSIYFRNHKSKYDQISKNLKVQ